MTDTVFVAVLSLAGTLVGTLGGILASGKMINYRIEQLEKKVSEHNRVVERTFRLEGEVDLLLEKINVANHRISDLENG